MGEQKTYTNVVVRIAWSEKAGKGGAHWMEVYAKKRDGTTAKTCVFDKGLQGKFTECGTYEMTFEKDGQYQNLVDAQLTDGNGKMAEPYPNNNKTKNTPTPAQGVPTIQTAAQAPTNRNQIMENRTTVAVACVEAASRLVAAMITAEMFDGEKREDVQETATSIHRVFLEDAKAFVNDAPLKSAPKAEGA